jgi:8-amino-7-oxononanoate synthase
MLIDHLNQQLHSRAQQGLMRQRRTVLGMHGAQAQLMHGAQAQLMGSAQAQLLDENGAAQIPPATQSALCFASNDYLGLSQHPDIIQALQDGAAQYGAGSGASHLVSGHSLAHAALEAALLDWLHPSVPDAAIMTMGSGYMANMALLTALGHSGDTTLFTDKLNHASLIDAAQLARAHVQRYPHNHTQRLGQLLASSTARIKLIVTDAVFSMDGDTAPLPELLALAEQHDAWLVLDDAHGLGIWGPGGQGTAAHYGLRSQRLIIMGTFGKALGTAGACVLAHRTIINWLVQTARPYIYTTACPPAISHATTTSVALVRSTVGDQRRAQLQANITQWRTGMAHLLAQHPPCGWQLLPSETAIQPLLIGDNQRTAALGQRLLNAGIWVGAIRPPTVPVGPARLRITLSAAHRQLDIQALLDALGRQACRACD